MQTSYDAVDLFAGPGGWDVAAHHLGLSVLGVEFDHAACETRRAVGLATIEADVRSLDPLDYDAPGLIASPPCQTFSMAGKGSGRAELDKLLEAIRVFSWEGDFEDDRTGLVLEPLRWIFCRAAQGNPYEWIALEQVPAVLPIWEAYAETLRELGYSVAVGKLSAEQYGVPQTRKRAILVASLTGEARLPEPTHSAYYPRNPQKLDPGVLPWVSMAEALGWGMTARPSMTVTGGGSATGGAEPFGNAARQGMVREAAAGRFVFRAGLQPNQARRPVLAPAPTLAFGHDAASAGWESDHGAREAPGFVRVTAEEASRLQTFPVGYPWQGGVGKQFQQIGNAVPPLLAHAVLAALLGLRVESRGDEGVAA